MERMLTIAVPTYNRAARLERQLEWIHHAIRDYRDQVRAAVSISMPVIRLTDVLEKRIPMLVMETANRITCALRDDSKNTPRETRKTKSRAGSVGDLN